VWDLDSEGQPRLARPHHFSRRQDHAVHFDDYLRPFLVRFAHEIRALDPDTVLFLEGQPLHTPPHWDLEAIPRVVYAPHWYDGLTLLTKRFIPFLGVDVNDQGLVLGCKRVQRSFAMQLARLKTAAAEQVGGAPTLLAEFGIPFDLRNKRAYRTGDFSAQIRAMDRIFQALECNLLSGTLWNYTADNDNRWGDQWNGEDLSIFSRDQQTDPTDLNSGGRALEVVVRPYARKVAGEPLALAFDRKHRVFTFVFRHDPAVHAPTEIFLPNYHYPTGCQVEVSDGQHELNREAQILLYYYSSDREVHSICVRPATRQER
jgi:hypothetical protein